MSYRAILNIKIDSHLIVLGQMFQVSSEYARFPLHKFKFHYLVHCSLRGFLNSELILRSQSSSEMFPYY